MSRYADKTTVSVAKSRGEIDRLLRDWNCEGIRWTDHYTRGAVVLEFLWKHAEQEYLARFEVSLPDDDELRAQSLYGGKAHGKFLPEKFKRLQDARGRQEHRLLLLWLKAALNAVDAGIVPAEVLFLPFLVGRDGRTVAQAALPRLPQLLAAGSDALLLPEATR